VKRLTQILMSAAADTSIDIDRKTCCSHEVITAVDNWVFGQLPLAKLMLTEFE
jgi:hypothetical protein